MKKSTTQHNEIKSWKWNFAAGFIPFMAGWTMFITSMMSKSNPDSTWDLVIAKLDFSYNDMINVSEDSGDFLDLISALSSVNIIIGAFSIIMISRFALKDGHKWAWWYMLVALIWLGFQDAYSVFRFFTETGVPFFIFPFMFCILMAIGLVLTRKEMFKSEKVL